MRPLIPWLLYSACALAADPTVRGPDSGMVFDAARQALRRVQGAPGAATLGDPLAGLSFTHAAVASRQGMALARIAGDAGQIAWVNGAGVVSPLPDSFAADLLAISGNGAAGAVYASETRRLRVVLRDGGRDVPLPDVYGPVRALAISDDGRRLLLAATDRQGSDVVYAIGETTRFVTRAGRVESLRYLSGGDAACVDAATGEVLLLRDPHGAGSVVKLRAAGNGTPVGLVAVDGAIAVAVASPPALEIYDTATATLTAASPLVSEPNACERLAASLLLLTAGAGGPWYVADLAAEMRVYFVPTR